MDTYVINREIPQGNKILRLTGSCIIRGRPGIEVGQTFEATAAEADELVKMGCVEEVQAAPAATIQTRDPIIETRDPQIEEPRQPKRKQAKIP